MKGISHFVSGVAAASFCPWAVEAAANGNPMYFVLGGAFGIMPDTLDFKLYRFFYKHDLYIEPDPLNPDPQAIADKLAEAIQTASESKRMIRVKLSTIRLGADYWQQYVVRFDPERQEIQVRFGPVVNTGQVPVPGTGDKEQPIGRAPLPDKFVQTYDATTRVDIFDGPTFGFEADGNSGVVLHFLPWHREWSHSYTLGAVFAALGWLLLDWRAAVVIMAGYSVHVTEDQLGFMGSNLFYPITRKRASGIHIMRSGDAWPNFLTVWISCMLIFWNLYRYNPEPLYSMNFLQLVFFAGILPLGLAELLLRLLSRGNKEDEEPIEMADEWGDNRLS